VTLGRALLWLAAAAMLAACDTDAAGVTWIGDGAYLVADGGHQVGALVVTGGDVRLAAGSRTDGPVLLLGGTLTIDGLVTGDVLAPAGDLALGPLAALRGAVGVGGGFERHPDALVLGEVTTGIGLPADVAAGATGGARVGWQALAAAVWAAAWARWAPRRLRTMGEAATRHAPVALALGALVFVIGLVAAVVMAFTIVLIPASLLLLVAGVLAVGTGWAALGLTIAQALARGPLRGRTVPLAAVGAFAVALALGATERVPWVGGAVALAISVAALGAVALTGFGGRPFVHAGDAAALDAAAAEPPA
jgi:hypothetical protein